MAFPHGKSIILSTHEDHCSILQSCVSVSVSRSLCLFLTQDGDSVEVTDFKMSTESQRPFVNGHASGSTAKVGKAVDEFNSELEAAAKDYQVKFHGDELLGDKQVLPTGTLLDIRDVFTWSNAKQIWEVLSKMITGQGLDVSMPLCGAAG